MKSILRFPILLLLAAAFMACNTDSVNPGGPAEDPEVSPPVVVPPPAVPQGGGNLSNLTGNGPVYFRSDLEDQSAACWNSNRNSSGYAPTSCGGFASIGAWGAKLAEGGVRHSGNKSMSFTFNKNEDVAGAALILSANVVSVRAWYNFAPGFDFGQGIKIARVSSFNNATQVNDMDMVMTVRSSGSVNQCGLTGMSDMGLFFNGRPVGFDWGNITSSRTFERGRWYAIEYQVSLNTPGQRDGWVKVWVDGVLAAQKTGINIRGNGGSAVKINRVRLGGWYSNSAGGNPCASPSQPSTVHIDDVVVATSYIGPN